MALRHSDMRRDAVPKRRIFRQTPKVFFLFMEASREVLKINSCSFFLSSHSHVAPDVLNRSLLAHHEARIAIAPRSARSRRRAEHPTRPCRPPELSVCVCVCGCCPLSQCLWLGCSPTRRYSSAYGLLLFGLYEPYRCALERDCFWHSYLVAHPWRYHDIHARCRSHLHVERAASPRQCV
jgi:hypothetical protein